MPQTHNVRIDVQADQSRGKYHPLWNWFGYDEPNYTYSANGQKLLADLADLGPVAPHVRTHNLLTSGDGTARLKWGSTNTFTEDAAGNPVLDWTIIDRIFDAWVAAGTIPFVQVSFTPQALSGASGPYAHDWRLDSPYTSITTGWAAPPNDLRKWGDLVFAWARHLADRYGEATVSTWPWEVWNEPDGHYWTGTIAGFCEMYAVTAGAIKRALPLARVGGPHTCGACNNPKAQVFLREFLAFCVRTAPPLDFVAFHAKGAPVLESGHVRMGLAKHLLDIQQNLAILAEYPSLRHLPVILGESDPEGCAACSARVHKQNGYRNGPLYGAYVVEHIVRTWELSRRSGIEIEGAVTWAFLFEGQPWFDGFRDLATNGINKAVLNAFRMLGKLGGEWVQATSDHALALDDILAAGVRGQPDVNAVATRDGDITSVLVWNYHDDDVEDGAASVTVALSGLPPGAMMLAHYRMDHDHGNAFRVWQDMGAPQQVSDDARRRLEVASRLAVLSQSPLATANGKASVSFTLPRQGVTLLQISP